MSEPLLQLCYISSCRPDMPVGEVERILSSSRHRNRATGVTGFLLFNGKRFMQHLEGPEPAVLETIARIRDDKRHHGIVELGRKQVSERIFSSWSMAFERVDSVLPQRRMPLDQQVEAMLKGVNPGVAQHFLGYARLTGNKAA